MNPNAVVLIIVGAALGFVLGDTGLVGPGGEGDVGAAIGVVATGTVTLL